MQYCAVTSDLLRYMRQLDKEIAYSEAYEKKFADNLAELQREYFIEVTFEKPGEFTAKLFDGDYRLMDETDYDATTDLASWFNKSIENAAEAMTEEQLNMRDC